MTGNAEELELKERLNLIETMIAEGRRTTGRWAWIFVFWGLAYYIAIAWTALFHWPWAWLVTMMAAWILSWAIQKMQRKHPEQKPSTTIGRAIICIWATMGVSLFLLLPALGFSGRFSQPLFVAIVAAMMGTANGASGLITRWKAQFATAVVWWAASVAACFASEDQSTIVFVVAIFFCQIVFGVYAMVYEARLRKQETAHA